MKQEREKIVVANLDALEELLDGFRDVCKAIVGQTRWETQTDYVVQRVSDGKYFTYTISRGSTEYQDSDSSDPTELSEVFPKVKTVVEFV